MHPDKINGYPVIAGRPVSDQEWLVIADRGQASVQRYVVWRAYRPNGDTVHASAGYYTSDLAKALENMETR